MLVNGDNRSAADTCRMILSSDSLDAAVWYKLGLAYRNMQPDEHSLECFIRAAECDTANNLYKFNLAKAWLSKNKKFRARPLLEELCAADSLNRDYAFQLGSLYMDEGTYEKALKLYSVFYDQDTSDHVILGKIGFVKLRQGKYEESISYYERSLDKYPKNLDAVRNLSFLYPNVNKTDTALLLLDRAIATEQDDVDLYARRGTIYWARELYKPALEDYMTILELGDSSFLYLKRAGIASVRRMKYPEALPLLLKAHMKDTTDYETIDYIAQCYIAKSDFYKTHYYYEKIIEMLKPLSHQLGVTHMNNGQAVYLLNDYNKALDNYLKCYELTKNTTVLMLIANVYDENLNNPARALPYYRQFLSIYKTKKNVTYTEDYITSIRNRVDYLERKQAEQKAKAEYDRKNREQQLKEVKR